MCSEWHSIVHYIIVLFFPLNKTIFWQPETSTFSPGLKLKIIKLLQNTIRVPSVQEKCSKEGSLALQGNILDTFVCITTISVKSMVTDVCFLLAYLLI